MMKIIPSRAGSRFEIMFASQDGVTLIFDSSKPPPLGPHTTRIPTTPSSAKMSKPAFWLRCEKKPFERRAALTPTTAKQLLDAGFDIYVERDGQRIFDDSEYEA